MSEFGDILFLLKTYGPLVAVTLALMYQSWRRECRCDRRIARLEDEMRGVILPLVRDCTAVITRNTVALDRLEKHL